MSTDDNLIAIAIDSAGRIVVSGSRHGDAPVGLSAHVGLLMLFHSNGTLHLRNPRRDPNASGGRDTGEPALARITQAG